MCSRDTSRANEHGFALIELLIALTVLAVALFVMVAEFTSGISAVTRASRSGNATSLVDQQMELYRGMTYCQIALSGTSAGAVTGADSTYTSDAAYVSPSATTLATNSWCTSQGIAAPYNTCPTSSLSVGTLNSCTAIQTVTAADGLRYRIDAYIVVVAGQSTTNLAGRDYKQVTLVVRDPRLSNHVLARGLSTFDPSTGG